MNNVETQLQKAREMKDKVEFFSQLLNRQMDDLRDRLAYLVNAGFPEDIASTYYANYFVHDNEIISNLSSRMRNEHVEYLDGLIDYLERAKNVR